MKCKGCGANFPSRELTCPYCGSGHTFLVTGNEFNIKEVEAY